jgi:hypothetical protein
VNGYVYDGDGRRVGMAWVFDGSPGGRSLVAGWVYDGAGARQWFALPPEDSETFQWGDTLILSDGASFQKVRIFPAGDTLTLAEFWGRETEERNFGRNWSETLTPSDAASFDRIRTFTFDDILALSEAWGRATEERNTGRDWSETLTPSDDATFQDFSLFEMSDTLPMSEAWARDTEERPPATEITGVDWNRTGLTSCPTAVETHCIGWSLTALPAGHHVRILRSENSGAFVQVATGLSLSATACATGGLDYGHQTTLGFGDNPGFNTTDNYRYRIQVRRDSDNGVVDEMDTANKGSSHSDCFE